MPQKTKNNKKSQNTTKKVVVRRPAKSTRHAKSARSQNGLLDSYEVPSAMGEGILFSEALAPGLSMVFGDYRWTPGLVSSQAIDFGDDVVFRFRLSGDVSLKFEEIGASLDIRAGWCSVFASSRPLSGIIEEVSGGERRSYVTIRMSRQNFLSLMGESKNELTDYLTKRAPRNKTDREYYFAERLIPPLAEIAIQQTLQCPLEGGAKRIYLEAKCRELVALYLSASEITSPKSNPQIKLSRAELEAVHAARDFLMENIGTPPGIEVLAKRVGLSPTKLKQGFYKEFGTSAFHYIRNRRLEKAKSMLSESASLSVEEVAVMCGFPNASHFTQAFRKHFGVLPKAIRGQKV